MPAACAVVVDYLAVRVVDRLEDCRRIGRLGHLFSLPIDSVRHLRIIKTLTFDKLDQLRNFLLANHRELQRQLGAMLGKSNEPCLQYGAADLIRPNSCLALFGAPKGNALHRIALGLRSRESGRGDSFSYNELQSNGLKVYSRSSANDGPANRPALQGRFLCSLVIASFERF